MGAGRSNSYRTCTLPPPFLVTLTSNENSFVGVYGNTQYHTASNLASLSATYNPFKVNLMNELIPIQSQTIDGNAVETVNARELHAFLESKQQFADWIKNRIEKYEFVENSDYTLLHKKMKANNATMIEYYITLDMAKELAMVERNEKGKQARRYFIECEKQLKQVFNPKQKFLLNILEADDELSRAVAINQYEVGYVKPLENKVVEQEEQIVVLQPKGQFYDAVVQSETLLDIGEVSKLLNYKGLGRNNLFRYLRENSILNNKNLPYQTYIDRGYFKIVESSWVNQSTKLVEVSLKTVMFQKGIDWLDKMLSEHFDKNKD